MLEESFALKTTINKSHHNFKYLVNQKLEVKFYRHSRYLRLHSSTFNNDALRDETNSSMKSPDYFLLKLKMKSETSYHFFPHLYILVNV